MGRFCYHFRMARPLRIEYRGAAYHVMSRGVARGDISMITSPDSSLDYS
jgi:hypothetical protein